jgi:hypothetical protein
MRKTLFLALLIFGLVQTTKADFVDFWYVYYNQTKIQEYNLDSNVQEIILKVDSIKKGDLIAVKYFRDTFCPDCSTSLTVEDEKHNVILTNKGTGTNTITFSLEDLITYKKTSGKDSFEIFYFKGDTKSSSDKILVFKIKLE